MQALCFITKILEVVNYYENNCDLIQIASTVEKIIDIIVKTCLDTIIQTIFENSFLELVLISI